MKKRITLLVFAVILLLSMVGCTVNENSALNVLDDKHASEIQNNLETFASADISEITECIFGISSDELSDDDMTNGIIADLFANAEVSVSAVDESVVTYTIISPDISDFFQAKADELQTITTSEELGQALLKYAQTAPQKEYTVSLDYSTTDIGIEVAYDNPEFINAMTGGLLDAYLDLYDQYLAEEG